MRILETVVTSMVFVFIFTSVIVAFIGNGTIKIERTYFNDYQEASENLELCQEKVDAKFEQLTCPAVECKPGSSGTMLAVMGGMFLVCGMAMYFVGLRKIDGDKKKSKVKK